MPSADRVNLAGGEDVQRDLVAAQWQELQVSAPAWLANMLLPGFSHDRDSESMVVRPVFPSAVDR